MRDQEDRDPLMAQGKGREGSACTECIEASVPQSPSLLPHSLSRHCRLSRCSRLPSPSDVRSPAAACQRSHRWERSSRQLEPRSPSFRRSRRCSRWRTQWRRRPTGKSRRALLLLLLLSLKRKKEGRLRLERVLRPLFLIRSQWVHGLRGS